MALLKLPSKELGTVIHPCKIITGWAAACKDRTCKETSIKSKKPTPKHPRTEGGVERVNLLPDFIDDFLLLFDFIPQPGQLLLVGFPVALHLLLQSLLQTPGQHSGHTAPLTQLWI